MKTAFLSLLCLLIPAAGLAAETAPSVQLSGYDREYYLRIFDYVMDNIHDDKAYHWSANTGNGDIRVGKEYVSKSNYVCRDFIETFEIEHKAGKIDGAGCKRIGSDGWCRVGKDDAHTCALEKPSNKINKAIDKSTDFLEKATDWLR